jgi:hypothetical protein
MRVNTVWGVHTGVILDFGDVLVLGLLAHMCVESMSASIDIGTESINLRKVDRMAATHLAMLSSNAGWISCRQRRCPPNMNC